MSLALAPLDWTLLGLYGAVVVGVALRARRQSAQSEDFLLGGRRLPWWALGVSIIATAFSSISLLGWTWKGYSEGLFWIQLQAGEGLAVAVVAVVFLPWYAATRATTAYELLERRYGRATRWVASAAFHVATLLRAGILLFATAKALALFTELDVDASILVVGLAAMAYSSVGGLGAVVWTDLLQMTLVVGGVIGSIALIAGDLPAGLAQVAGGIGTGVRPDVVDLSPDPARHPSLWSALIAYGVLALSVAATSQTPVQRYLACRDLAQARRALVLSFGIGLGVMALTLFLGVALYAWNAHHGGSVERWHTGAAVASDTVFPGFIAERVPTGLAGLLVAAIFAAAMSSIDSAIHSMATATQVDFVERLARGPLADRRRLAWARRLTVLYGVLCVGAALYASRQPGDLIDQLLRWFAILGGPMLGLFALARSRRGPRQAGVLAAVGAGYAAAFAFDPPFAVGLPAGGLAAGLGFHPIWAAAAGFGTTLLGAALFAALGRAGRR